MATITTIASSDTLTASRAVINTNFGSLQNLFASAVAPTSPIAYQLWWDTTSAAAPVLNVRNSANSAWIIIMPNGGAVNGALLGLAGGTMTGTLDHGGQAVTNLPAATAGASPATKTQTDGRERIATIVIGTQSATFNQYIWTGGPAVTVSDVAVVASATIASSGVDYWTFVVRDLTASLNLKATASTTNGSAMTADTNWAFGCDQNLTPAANAVIQLQATKTGSPTALTSALLVVRYKVAI